MKRRFGPSEIEVPVIGQGTWQMGRDPDAEVAALRRGLELGLTHVDTAEMYGPAEDVTGQALADGRRDGVFLVSKVLPSHASYAGTIEACERSLDTLGTDHLDLYLLHWPGSHPIAETMRGLEELVAQGKTRLIGVSNFDTDGLRAAEAALTRERLACNQVHYDMEHRGIERQLLPYCQERQIALVGYSPFGQGALPSPTSRGGEALARVAAAHEATPTQVILAFLTRLEGTFTIPKASRLAHVEDNAAALGLRLSDAEINELDAAFPAPPGDVPLSMR
jgi:diketogulonate reductase-like aldo/keto reductase